ncbi:MAG: translation initiation factor IF-3 [Candidatus Berkelbacteria bacterium]|nr:translation initiation factor IF-3 [Candidatus Berkelbacteria bacterium]
MRILNNPFELKTDKVLLISEVGEKKGEMDMREAFKIAEESGLNLAVVSEKAIPPIVRLIDWGKYQYEKAKNEKKARAKSKALEMKEIRLSPRIDEHDFEFKRRRAEKFLEKGHALKLSLRLKGRENQFVDQATEVVVEFSRKLAHVSKVDQTPQRIGGTIVTILRPKNN